MLAEIAIAMFNSENPIGARVNDVIEARPALGYIGQQDQRLFYWMVVDVDDLSDLAQLKKPRISNPEAPDEQQIKIGQALYTIPFEQIRKQIPDFDALRAMAKYEVYQPGLNLNEQTGHYAIVGTPGKFKGSIIDKNTDRPFMFRGRNGRPSIRR